MNQNTKLPTKQFYLLLITCSVIIFATSLDALFRVKDFALFNEWVISNELRGTATESELLSLFVSANLSVFFTKIIIPVTFALYTYYAYIKLRINKLFVFIWTVLNIGGLAYTIVEFRFDSLFYYVISLSYIFLIYHIVNLSDMIKVNNSK